MFLKKALFTYYVLSCILPFPSLSYMLMPGDLVLFILFLFLRIYLLGFADRNSRHPHILPFSSK